MSGFTLLGRLCVCPHLDMDHGVPCATGLSALCGMREGTVRRQIIHVKNRTYRLACASFPP